MMLGLIAVRCPGRTCRAGPGMACRTSDGTIRAEPHHLRWLATQTHVVKCPDCENNGCARCHWTTFCPRDE